MKHIFEYSILGAIALGAAGETYSHLIPNKWLPSSFRAKERKELLGKISALVLVVALFFEVPMAVSNNNALDAALNSLMTNVDRLGHNVDSIKLTGGGFGPRHLSPEQREAIQREVSPDAQIMLEPSSPGEPEEFAHELELVFHSVSRQTSTALGAMRLDWSEGLVVLYDHSDERSISVFRALSNASLHPVGRETQEAIVHIRVAPQQRQ